MPHFAECIVFNVFNSISFRAAAAKASVARADEKARAEAPPISEKQYPAPAALARNCRPLPRAPARLASRFGGLGKGVRANVRKA
jgi:hypothetical protein